LIKTVIMIIIRERIRMARLGKGYSQDYMATQLNISQRAYCKIECGDIKLTVDRLIDIAKILELDYRDFLNKLI